MTQEQGRWPRAVGGRRDQETVQGAGGGEGERAGL